MNVNDITEFGKDCSEACIALRSSSQIVVANFLIPDPLLLHRVDQVTLERSVAILGQTKCLAHVITREWVLCRRTEQPFAQFSRWHFETAVSVKLHRGYRLRTELLGAGLLQQLSISSD